MKLSGILLLSLSTFSLSTAYHTIPPFYNCGGMVDQSGDVITSPYFPRYYPSRATCDWFVRAPADIYAIKFKFDVFNLGYGRYRCGYGDYVRILNGNRQEEGRRFCGNEFVISEYYKNLPPTQGVNVVGNVATLQFRSDFYGSYQGFNVTVTFVQRPECPKANHCKDSNGETEILEGPDGNFSCVCKGCPPTVCPTNCDLGFHYRNIPRSDCNKCECKGQPPFNG